MTLLADALTGSQTPRVLTRPLFVSEAAGQEAIDLAESVGLHLDPWQQLIVNVALAEEASGRYAAGEVAYLVSRQNGKGAALEAIVLHGMFLVQDPLTLWTAHQFKTSSEAFIRVRGWIDGSDDLRRKVKRINAAHGEEGIELKAGPRLRFLARSKSSGRGFSPQRIIFDEAQELAKVAAEAMLPSMRAQWNRQAIYTGTVPGPDINNPEHFTRLRDRGREGKSPRLAWLEWTPEGSDTPETAGEIDLSDPTHWSAASPGIGFRDGLTLATLADDHEALDGDSFGRECLSIWPTLPTLDMDAAFGPGKWAECFTEEPRPAPVTIGLAVSSDRAWGSIAAAGGGQVGAVERRAGTDWLVAEVVRIQAEHGVQAVVDGHGPGKTLIKPLSDAGIPPIVTNTDDYTGACAQFFDDVQTAAVGHANDVELNAAVGLAAKRNVGDGAWAWSRRQSSGDISMLEAATLAHWAAATSAPLIFS